MKPNGGAAASSAPSVLGASGPTGAPGAGRPHGADAELVVSPEEPPLGTIVAVESDAAIEAEGVIRSGQLAGKGLWAAIWILAIPVLIQQTMQACVGLIDMVITGALLAPMVVPALDAIAIGSYVGWFINIALGGLGVGGQVLIARAVGGGDRALGTAALAQSLTLSLLWSALVGLALWFACEPLIALTNLSEEAGRYCLQYVRTLAVAMPFTGIMTVGTMCLHGAGETTRPSVIAFIVNIVNIIASYVLSGVDVRIAGRVIENPFPFDWYVLGIAAGTAVSFAVGAVMTLRVLIRGVKDLRLEAQALPVERGMFMRILRIGVPNFAEGIAFWAVNLFVMGFIGQIAKDSATVPAGKEVVEGLQGSHVMAAQIEAFAYLPGFAMGTAAGALAGQYLGARNPRMAARAILACCGVGCTIMGLLGILFIAEGRWLTSLISSHPVHLDNTPKLLSWAGLIQVFFALVLVLRQGLRGVGDTRWTFIITTVSAYGVRLPLCYLLGLTLGLGLEGIWIGLCAELVVRSMLFAARFLHGGWRHVRV
jgi:putative MATE family efflux protein